MKELSVEQKAKRYDEVIELVNSKWHYRNQPCIIDVSEIFTELKESDDEKIRKNLIELFHDTVSNDEIFSDYGLDKTEVLDWLKKCEKKPTWSEEDKVMLDEIIDFFENGTVKLQHDLSLYASFLKSLTDRYTWKPSDEQMDALQYVYRNINPPLSDKLGWNSFRTLELMFEQLKKLKG